MLCADQIMLLAPLTIAGVVFGTEERRAVIMLLSTFVLIISVQTENAYLGSNDILSPLSIGHGSKPRAAEWLVSIMILINVNTVTLIFQHPADSTLLNSFRPFEYFNSKGISKNISS